MKGRHGKQTLVCWVLDVMVAQVTDFVSLRHDPVQSPTLQFLFVDKWNPERHPPIRPTIQAEIKVSIIHQRIFTISITAKTSPLFLQFQSLSEFVSGFTFATVVFLGVNTGLTGFPVGATCFHHVWKWWIRDVNRQDFWRDFRILWALMALVTGWGCTKTLGATWGSEMWYLCRVVKLRMWLARLACCGRGRGCCGHGCC